MNKPEELTTTIRNYHQRHTAATHNFLVQGVSRALLQELVCHVEAHLNSDPKSTERALEELLLEGSFISLDHREGWLHINAPFAGYWVDQKRAEKYLVLTHLNDIDACSIQALNNLRLRLLDGVDRKMLRYCLPESYKIDLSVSISPESLSIMSSLSDDKSNWELRTLVDMIYDALPAAHRCMYINKDANPA